MELLDEITEIPFQVFWKKWNEIRPTKGKYNKAKAQKELFFMKEEDRVKAFEDLCKKIEIVYHYNEPYRFLSYYSMPF